MNRKNFLLILGLFFLTACSSNGDFIGTKKVYKSNELTGFERTIQFPTYSPFKVDDTVLETEFRGPVDLVNNSDDSEDVDGLETFAEPRDRKNKEFYVILTRYMSRDKEKVMEIEQSSTSIFSLDSIANYDENKLIDFGKGLRGFYMANRHAQTFYWEDSGTTFGIHLYSLHKDKTVGELYPKEEIIKIAESFKQYK
ncbi:hypothetical protein [Ornithinibacillus xuwenensis]|uniref:Lipoprotein n=1 Tax=Ornithinibacillus xuwenensis TaxID=3144668 RepID=A0ABU9XEZ7_9BACI